MCGLKRQGQGRIKHDQPLDREWRDIEGAECKGQVDRLEKFGAFVENGAERPGLIHISEWRTVTSAGLPTSSKKR